MPGKTPELVNSVQWIRDLTNLKLLISQGEVHPLGQDGRCWIYALGRVPLFNFQEIFCFSFDVLVSCVVVSFSGFL